MIDALKEVMIEFIGFITPFAFVAVVFFGLRAYFSDRKFNKTLKSK